MEGYSSSAAIMRVTETGWDSESVQSWYVKYTGKYRNNLVWAGDYKMDFSYLSVVVCVASPVQMELYNQASGYSSVTYGVMRVTETGWDSEAIQTWNVKYTGKYRNNLVWAGDYKLDYSKMNVYNESDEKCAKQD